MQKTIKELEDIKTRVEDLLITLKQSNKSKTTQDDKPSFVKNLWSRNPQKINDKYPSIMGNFKEDMIDDLLEEQQEMGGEW
tara:strand:+ start:924 stop:1166 length:243 start_codon:yes stop_codon:yes gene_type:complete